MKNNLKKNNWKGKAMHKHPHTALYPCQTKGDVTTRPVYFISFHFQHGNRHSRADTSVQEIPTVGQFMYFHFDDISQIIEFASLGMEFKESQREWIQSGLWCVRRVEISYVSAEGFAPDAIIDYIDCYLDFDRPESASPTSNIELEKKGRLETIVNNAFIALSNLFLFTAIIYLLAAISYVLSRPFFHKNNRPPR